MLKKILLSFLIFIFGFLFVKPTFAQEKKQVDLYFFWSQACPHCAKEKIFLEKIAKKYPEVNIQSYEVSEQQNIKLWQEAGKKLGVKIGSIPFTVVGERSFVGFLSEETTGFQIELAIKEAFSNGCENILADSLVASPSPCPEEPKKSPSSFDVLPEAIKLPFFGNFNIKKVSLPLLTLVLGLLDGFNPCAMWSLLFLISLLLGMKDRTKMWLLGSAFIFVSGFVYFLFMTAWLNFFLWVGYIKWIRWIIGLVALGFGIYSLHDYAVNKNASCKVVANKKRKKIFDKLKEITQKKEFLLALGGIILLAFAVNLVELICSVGLPVIFTQVLAVNKLPQYQYYLYLFGYIFFYILDDLIVFFLAMITLKATGLDSKYNRFSRLIGGIIIILIGILLLFKPQWLMFG